METRKKNKTEESKDLVPFAGGLPADMTKADLQKIYDEEMRDTAEDIIPRLAQIQILHAGAEAFRMSADKSGEEPVVKTFSGIVVDKHRCNAYWVQSFAESGGGVPPDCSSLNAQIGVMTGGDTRECGPCPHNQWGSAGDNGKGKACKNMMRITVMLEGHKLPQRLTLPPTSLRPADEYFSRLIDLGLPMRSIITEFSLAEARSGEGISYSQIRMNNGDQISYEEFRKIKEFWELHSKEIRGQEIQTDEYINPEDKE